MPNEIIDALDHERFAARNLEASHTKFSRFVHNTDHLVKAHFFGRNKIAGRDITMRAAQIAIVGDKQVEIGQPPQVSCCGPSPLLWRCTRPIAYKIDGAKLFKISESLVNRPIIGNFVALAQAAGDLAHGITTITLSYDFR